MSCHRRSEWSIALGGCLRGRLPVLSSDPSVEAAAVCPDGLVVRILAMCSVIDAGRSPALALLFPQRDEVGSHRFVGRPPFLPHCESLFLYLWVVAFPPFLPMHRGQIIRVRGCNGQYVSLATAYFYLKTPLQGHPLAFFFLGLPACPSPTSTLCT